MPKYIMKRDGRLEEWNPEKITRAVLKAMEAVGVGGLEEAKKITSLVVAEVEKRLGEEHIPSVEEVQDLVEEALMREGLTEVARAYIVYRQKRAEIRGIKKQFIGVQDDLKLSINALSVLKRRYLVKDERGNVVETPGSLTITSISVSLCHHLPTCIGLVWMSPSLKSNGTISITISSNT